MMNTKKDFNVFFGLPSSRFVDTLVILLQLLTCLADIEALRMTALNVPQHVVLNQTVRMECDFDLDKETLYSVKWYKDGHEFYRYVPEELPNVHVFLLPGVLIDEHSSSERSVVMHRVNSDSTGRYRCEVSAEAPYFHTISEHADMTVVVLPQEGPTISGGKTKYQAGDLVRMNCTSAPSRPPALLMWYVNNEPADQQFIKGPRIIRVDSNGLKVSQLGIEFRIRRGDIKLRCLATISSVYRRSKEHYVAAIEKYLKQPMESRETRAQSHRRSEPNAGESKSCTGMLAIISSILSISAVWFFKR